MSSIPPTWGAPDQPRQLRFTSLADIEMKPIRFVEEPYLQAGAFHLLAGIKNSGKGTWLASLTARITRGELGAKTHVIWIALGEDSYAMDVRPRLEAHGGDASNVTVIDDGDFELPADGPELEALCRERSTALVIVDPVGGAILGKNTNTDAEIRPALHAMNHLADRTDTMVIGVRHISNKVRTHTEGALSAILGSSDWVNIPRAVLGLIHDDVDRSLRHLFVLTGNRTSEDTPGLLMRVESVGVVVGGHPVTKMTVLGESMKDPDQLLAATTKKERSSKTSAARQLILDTLAQEGGSMESDRLDAKIAELTGLAVRTLRNVRTELKDQGLTKVQPVKDGGGEITAWFVTLSGAGWDKARSTSSPGTTFNHDLVNSREKPTSPTSPDHEYVKPGSGRDLGNDNGHPFGDIVTPEDQPLDPNEPTLLTPCPLCDKYEVGATSRVCHACGTKLNAEAVS